MGQVCTLQKPLARTYLYRGRVAKRRFEAAGDHVSDANGGVNVHRCRNTRRVFHEV